MVEAKIGVLPPVHGQHPRFKALPDNQALRVESDSDCSRIRLPFLSRYCWLKIPLAVRTIKHEPGCVVTSTPAKHLLDPRFRHPQFDDTALFLAKPGQGRGH